MSKKHVVWFLLAAGCVAAALAGYQYRRSLQESVPEGIAFGNGRIEAKLVDVATKEPLRVKEVLVDEGALVQPGEVLVRLDTSTLEAQLAEAQANVASTQANQAVVASEILKKKSEVDLALVELERDRKLLPKGAVSQQDYDRHNTAVQVSRAALQEEEARLRTVGEEIKVAQADVATIQTRIDDATLRSPVRGRVLYRLTEVGEVLGAGGKALTLVNLEDVYMEIFLPAEQAARVQIGSEARLTVDHAPGRAAAGYVSFVSPEAQFTPKQVETRSERDKLMFRVKIQVPEELIRSYIERIKTGVRGVAYVKLDPAASWPAWLQDLLAPAEQPGGETPPTAPQTPPAWQTAAAAQQPQDSELPPPATAAQP